LITVILHFLPALKILFSGHWAFAESLPLSYKNAMNSAQKQLYGLFSGHVQGVGFRFTVCRIAEGFSITGYVRNLGNGDVELVAEGAEPELSEFIYAIRNSQLRRYIVQDRVTWKAATGEFDRFGVSF
jgi:acylphosphatase